MEHFEEVALDTADQKPAKWLRYVDEIFLVWPRGPARLRKCLHHFNILRSTIKVTMEVEAIDTLPFLGVLDIKRGLKLATKVYRTPTHTRRYLHFKSNHPHHVKRGAIHGLINRDKVRIRRISERKLRT
jgi:hypothetical protein